MSIIHKHAGWQCGLMIMQLVMEASTAGLSYYGVQGHPWVLEKGWRTPVKKGMDQSNIQLVKGQGHKTCFWTIEHDLSRSNIVIFKIKILLPGVSSSTDGLDLSEMVMGEQCVSDVEWGHFSGLLKHAFYYFEGQSYCLKSVWLILVLVFGSNNRFSSSC